MEQSELLLKDTMMKSRSKAFDSPENQLSLTLGSITVYIPISMTDVLPHINVQSSTLLLQHLLESITSKDSISLRSVVLLSEISENTMNAQKREYFCHH